MAKFKFNLRDPRAKEKTAISLIIRWDNKKLVYSTFYNVNPVYWQLKKGKTGYQGLIVSGNNQIISKLSNDLGIFISKASDTFLSYQVKNKKNPDSPEELKKELDITFERIEKKYGNSFYGFIEDFIEKSKNRYNPKTGKKISTLTIAKYNTTLAFLRAFENLRKKEISFSSIDLDFYHDFSAFISTNEMKRATNTIGKHIQTLKTFLNAATDEGLNKNLSFKSSRFKVVNEESDSIYLNEDELTKIYELDLSENKRLEKVRDLFIVGSWTGLRFSDFTKLSQDHVKGDFLEIETEKTGEKVVIPIHPVVKEIFKKYKGENGLELPPPISNAKMNEYLKDVGELVGCLKTEVLTKITRGGERETMRNFKYNLISTHTARRSFATNLYLDGVPAITIMKITGHRTERAFLKYIKMTPAENAKLLQMHWQNKAELKEQAALKEQMEKKPKRKVTKKAKEVEYA